MRTSSEIDTLEDLEFTLNNTNQNNLKSVSKRSIHYVNGKELYEEYVLYHEKKKEALANDQPIPPLTNKIGAAIIQIAARRCNSRKYVSYSDSWKEEMISNAITVAAIHGHNFDPTKSQNVFAYITAVCDNAIIEQIKKEKKQLYIRYKQFDNLNGYQASDEFGDSDDGDEGGSTPTDFTDSGMLNRIKYVSDYEDRMEARKSDFSKKSQKVNPEIVPIEF